MIHLDHKTKYILTLNTGSSSLKWTLFTNPDLAEGARGTIENLGSKKCFSEARVNGQLIVSKGFLKDYSQALNTILKLLAYHHFLLTNIKIVVHRIVHGGDKFTGPALLNAQNIKKIKQFDCLAPLHNPLALKTAAIVHKLLPRSQSWAVFDTAWFRNLPDYSALYGLPIKLQHKYHLRRYGFHGLSHQYVTEQAAYLLNKELPSLNVITCHLGGGASVAVVRGGKPIDTSMGFTPNEGLIMSTRSGDVDPGLILYLINELKINPRRLEKIISEESGIKGLAGVDDMKELMVQAGYEILGYRSAGKYYSRDKQAAQLALKMFIYRVQKYIGFYQAILGRVDAIIFTGAIGERNETIRNLVMRGLPVLKSIPILPIATNEELAMARQIVLM